jgi:hypothetical protein
MRPPEQMTEIDCGGPGDLQRVPPCYTPLNPCLEVARTGVEEYATGDSFVRIYLCGVRSAVDGRNFLGQRVSGFCADKARGIADQLRNSYKDYPASETGGEG